MPNNEGDLKVCWYPQIPCKPFEVEVNSVEEGVAILDCLANYDSFLLANRHRADYCNSGTLMVFTDLSEDDSEGCEWVDWFYEAGDDYFDDPREYLEWKKQSDAS